MVLFWTPPELPLFNKLSSRQQSASTIVHLSGDATPTESTSEATGKKDSHGTLVKEAT